MKKRTLTLGVRCHDMGLEAFPACFSVDAVEKLADNVLSRGFSAVQFAMERVFPAMKPTHLNQGMAWKLRNAFESRGIQIAVLSCYKNLIHPDKEEQKRELNCFRRYLEFCRELGGNYVATETGSRNIDYSFHPDNHSPQVLDELVDNVRQMVTWAEDFGVGVAIEGVLKYPARSPAVIRKILDCIDNSHLHVILDPVNLLDPSAGENIRQQYINAVEESFNLYGDAIIAMHLKDCRCEEGKLVSVPIGTGSIPFDFLIKLVSDRKPYLPLILEEQNPLTMENSINFLEGLTPL